MVLTGDVMCCAMGQWNACGVAISNANASCSDQIPTMAPSTATRIELQRVSTMRCAASDNWVSGVQVRIGGKIFFAWFFSGVFKFFVENRSFWGFLKKTLLGGCGGTRICVT